MSKAARRRLYHEAMLEHQREALPSQDIERPAVQPLPIPTVEQFVITPAVAPKMTLLPKATTPPAERWEYAYLPETKTEDNTLATLNAAGADGWEVVEGRQYYWLMKRRLA